MIDAGGSNLRVCLATFVDDNGKINFPVGGPDDNSQKMPGRKDENETAGVKATAKEFYKCIAGKLKDWKDQFNEIGFCFSYPAEITKDEHGNIDGRLEQ